MTLPGSGNHIVDAHDQEQRRICPKCGGRKEKSVSPEEFKVLVEEELTCAIEDDVDIYDVFCKWHSIKTEWEKDWTLPCNDCDEDGMITN